LVGAERPLEHLAGLEVLELRADEGAALARFDVLEVDHRHEPLGEVQHDAGLQVVGGDVHARSLVLRLTGGAPASSWQPVRGVGQTHSTWGVRVSPSQPLPVTTTLSSMRTPPTPPR